MDRRFGEVTWTVDPADAEGLTKIARVEAMKEVTWPEAMGAIGASGNQCEDGGSFLMLEMTPPLATDPDDVGKIRYPAGTVFEERIQCVVAFPDEIAIEAGLDTAEGLARIEAELAEDGEFDRSRHMTSPVRFGARVAKYPAIHQSLGYLLAQAKQECGDAGVVFTKLVVMSPPMPPEDAADRETAYVGVERECVAAAAGEKAP